MLLKSDLLLFYETKTIFPFRGGKAALCLTTPLSNWTLKKNINIYGCFLVTWKANWELALAFVSLMFSVTPMLVLMCLSICGRLCSCLHALWHSSVSMCLLSHIVYELHLTVCLHWRQPQWDSRCRFKEDEAGQSVTGLWGHSLEGLAGGKSPEIQYLLAV